MYDIYNIYRLWEDSAETIACPSSNQKEYWDQVQQSTPPEADFIWRIVLCFGAFPAATSLYLRSMLAESPR